MKMRDEDWREDALCRQTDPEIFHPEEDDHTAVSAAKATCAACSVITDCLGWALHSRAQQGIAGGLSKDERAELRAELYRPLPVLVDLRVAA